MPRGEWASKARNPAQRFDPQVCGEWARWGIPVSEKMAWGLKDDPVDLVRTIGKRLRKGCSAKLPAPNEQAVSICTDCSKILM